MNNPMTLEQIMAELAAVRAENTALKAKPVVSRGNHIRVSQKGAVSIYGFSKFPITLYKTQWQKILGEMREDILKFIADNESALSVKATKENA